eukprot:1159220-Pelagomonas_calceolata.AAC.9
MQGQATKLVRIAKAKSGIFFGSCSLQPSRPGSRQQGSLPHVIQWSCGYVVKDEMQLGSDKYLSRNIKVGLIKEANVAVC